MTMTNTVDAARVELLLSELRLPGIKLMWAKLAEQSDKEGWPAARFLAALAEHEVADRGRRRLRSTAIKKQSYIIRDELPRGGSPNDIRPATRCSSQWTSGNVSRCRPTGGRDRSR
jgi:hypothetical protein